MQSPLVSFLKNRLLSLLSVLALGGVLIMNGLANSLPLNGKMTGQIASQYASLVVPAGYVFSIWGVIYLLLAGFVVYQVLPSRVSDPLLVQLRIPFVITCLLNVSWLLSWHYEQLFLSVLLMLGLLGSLIWLMRPLETARAGLTRAQYVLTWAPFATYIGWISVATAANISTLLLSWGWTGAPLGPEIITAALLLVLTGLGLYSQHKHDDPVFSLVLIWALLGIAIKHNAVPVVSYPAFANAVLLGYTSAVRLIKKGR